MAVDIMPAKGTGSTGISFYLGCPVDVNKSSGYFLSSGNGISASGVSKYRS